MQNESSNKEHYFINKLNININSSAVNKSIYFIITTFVLLGIAVFLNTKISGLSINNEAVKTISDGYNIHYSSQNETISLPYKMTDKTKAATLTRTFTRDELAGDYIAFYAYNSAVNIYIDGVQTYSENNILDFSGFARPSHWYFIKVPDHDFTLTIDMASQLNIKNVLEITSGTKSALLYNIVKSHTFQIVIGFLAVICGVMLMISSFLITADLNIRMRWIALISIIAGIWTLCNSTVIQIFFSHGTFMSYIGYCCYFIFPLTVTGFLLTFETIQKEKYMYIVYWFQVLLLAAIFIMQLSGIIIVSNVIWLVHLEIITLTLLVVITYIKNWHSITTKELDIFISFVIIAFFLTLDIVRYYSHNATFERVKFSVYGVLLLLIYFTFSIFYVIKENFVQNTRNEIYKELAFTDAMTMIHNRSAFEIAMENERKSHSAHGYLLIADLNNLKHVNDTYGHRFGDEAIKNTARLIHDSFDGVGECYRIGGDEFCVLAPEADKAALQRCLNAFENAVNRIAVTTSYPYSVATGYGAIDETGIDNCFKVVDSIMYENKIKSKKCRRQ